MSNRRINIWVNIDWSIIGLYLVLVLLGWVNIYSVEYNEETSGIFDLSHRYGKQLLWIILALVLAFIFVIIDTNFYVYFAYPLYIFMMVLLIAVLFLGKEIHGAKSWFAIGGFQFQPSEFAKFITGLALARFLSSTNTNLKSFRHIFQSFSILLIPAILIILQPDTGSSLVYASLAIVLFREGLPGIYVIIGLSMAVLFILTLIFNKLYIVIGLIFLAFLFYFLLQAKKRSFFIGLAIFVVSGGVFKILNELFSLDFKNSLIILVTLGVSGIAYAILSYINKLKYVIAIYLFVAGAITFTYSVDYVFHNVLEEHQQKRINVVLGVESDPLGSGYNVNQSKIAIGSGGFWGKGFLKGTQTKFNFVPEQSTDFIFCTVGEEWGFVGGIVLISLFMLLLLRILYVAERQRSKFNRIYGYSVFSILFFHFVINIGMTIGLVPVIGIPLPFISYGGSSLWAFTILIFIFLKMDASRTESL